MGRAPCCDNANVKKGPWSPDEDSKLKEYMHKYGTGGNWLALPQKVGLKRCGKSCRLRWLNYLRPNLKHGGFSEKEDNIICSLYVSIGSRWSIIAAQLPGRTDNDIKNYWNTRLKKKLLGRFKDNQICHLAAARQDGKDVQSYATSDSFTSPNIYGPQRYQHINTNMDANYSNFGPGIIPHIFEQNCGLTITESSSSSEPATFWLNPQQVQLNQEVFDHNSCLRKLSQRHDEIPVDHRSNNCVSTINTGSPKQSSNCINPSQILHSIAHNQYTSDAANLQIYNGMAASAALVCDRQMNNHIRLGNPSAVLTKSDNSLAFSASSSSEVENYESAWMNPFSAESNNLGAYGFSTELNDLLLYSTESLIQQREAYNTSCGSVSIN